MTSATNFKDHPTIQDLDTGGVRMCVILSTSCSGGHLTIVEEEVSIGACLPANLCPHEDKVILVTDGKFALYAEDKKYEVEKGCNIFIPRGVPHQFKNVGTQTGKLLTTTTPCGHQNFLKDLQLSVKVFRKDPATMHKVAHKNGVVLA